MDEQTKQAKRKAEIEQVRQLAAAVEERQRLAALLDELDEEYIELVCRTAREEGA